MTLTNLMRPYTALPDTATALKHVPGSVPTGSKHLSSAPKAGIKIMNDAQRTGETRDKGLRTWAMACGGSNAVSVGKSPK